MSFLLEIVCIWMVCEFMILNKFMKLMMDSLAGFLCQFESHRVFFYYTIFSGWFLCTSRWIRIIGKLNRSLPRAKIDIRIILMARENPFIETISVFSRLRFAIQVCGSVAMKNRFYVNNFAEKFIGFQRWVYIVELYLWFGCLQRRRKKTSHDP